MIGFYCTKPREAPVFNSLKASLKTSSLALDQSHCQIFGCDIKIYGDIAIGCSGYLRGQPEPERYVYDMFCLKGPRFVRDLEGSFFITIYRQSDQSLFLFNNFIDAFQLYYFIDGQGVYFSKHLQDLLRTFPISRKVHFGSVRSFLANGFTWSDQTQLDGVKKLLPAHYIHAQPEGIKVANLWEGHLQFRRRQFANLEDHLDLYESRFRQGIADYLDQSQPKELGCLLSGGHDTSFVLHHAAQCFAKPVHAFTVTFPDWNFSEESSAANIARKTGSIHHCVPFRPDNLNALVSLIQACEEPVVGSTLPLHCLADQASRVVDCMFGGDGGDTLWAEYHPVAEVHRYIKYLPLMGRKSVHRMSRGVAKVLGWERLWELEHVLGLFARPDFYQHFMLHLCTYRHFDQRWQNRVFRPEVVNVDYSVPSYEVPFNAENFDEALIEGKLFNAFFTYQSFSQSKSLNYFGLPFFLPSLTKDVVDLITSLPRHWVNGGTTLHRLSNSKKTNRMFHKMALKRHFEQGEIYNRSFDMPWHRLLKPRKELLGNLKNSLLNRGWFQEEGLNELFEGFLQFRNKDHEIIELRDNGYRIFTLMSLEAWCRIYLDDRWSGRAGLNEDLERFFA